RGALDRVEGDAARDDLDIDRVGPGLHGWGESLDADRVRLVARLLVGREPNGPAAVRVGRDAGVVRVRRLVRDGRDVLGDGAAGREGELAHGRVAEGHAALADLDLRSSLVARERGGTGDPEG